MCRELIRKLILPLILCAAPAYGQAVRGTPCSNAAASNSATASCAVTLSPNQAIIVLASSHGAIQNGLPTDSFNLTWTGAASNTFCGAVCDYSSVFCALTGTNSGSDTVSVTNNQFSAGYIAETVVPYSGVSSCTPQATATGNSAGVTYTTGTVSTSSGLTTTLPNELIVVDGNFLAQNGSPLVTSGSGYGNTISVAFLGGASLAVSQDQNAATAGTYTASMIINSGTPSAWTLAAAAFGISSGTVSSHAQVY